MVLTFARLILLVVVLTAQSVAADARPNVLFVLADDLGIGDLRCFGNPVVDTPVIDALAKSGIRLTQHYAPSPLCAPSRAGFLTGRFNHRTGAVDVPSNRGLDRIALSEVTFGDYFQRAGYRTALIGKWHNGLYCRDYLPHARGFDLFFGFANGGQDYWKWHLQRNDELVVHDGRYLSDVLNEETSRFIRSAKSENRPFAVFLSHHAPHQPFQAPAALIDKYRRRLGPQASENVARIYAMIEAMDTGLGRVVATLREEKLLELTVIVFTSDNGAQLGRAAGGSTQRYHAGFSGNKGDVGEQGIRVPAIVSMTGTIPGGRVEATPVHGCDWLPTLAEAARLDTARDRFDGTSVWPLLTGRAQSGLVDRVLRFQKNRYRPAAHSDAAIRSGRWKLVWPGVPVTMRKDIGRDNPSYLRGVVRPHWEMPLDRELAAVPVFTDPRPRLFDLRTDPFEEADVASRHPEIVKRLTQQYNTWFDDVMNDWRRSRQAILEHDRSYWMDRTPPEPVSLFREFWQWHKAPAGTDPKKADPLSVFRGYWSGENPNR